MRCDDCGHFQPSHPRNLDGTGVCWNLESPAPQVHRWYSCPGDLVLLLSNGGFGGIYDKLPAALAGRTETTPGG